MKTITEQYEIQYKELKERHKKNRNKRMIKSILIALLFFFIGVLANAGILIEKNEGIMYVCILFMFAFIIKAIRDRIMKTPKEKREINELNKIYEEERFKERNG